MPSFPTRTYKELIDAIALTAGLEETISAKDERRLRVYINSAMRRGWEGYRWPYLIEVEAGTAGDVGSYDDVDILEITRLDPIKFLNSEPVALTITNSGLAIADDLITDDTEVFFIYRKRFIPFIGENYDSSVFYGAGDVVYGPTSGDWYLSVRGGRDNPLIDTDFWERLYIPSFLFDFVRAYSVSEYLDSQGQLEKAASYVQRGVGYRIEEIEKIETQKGLYHRTFYHVRTQG